MCTKPRIIVPQVFYEITSKGVHGVNIFPDKELKALFLKELAISLNKFSYQCYGWSVMDDHYHLVVKSSHFSVSSFMQRLNSSYAKQFNRKCGRKGVVFYRRFASVIVQEKNCLQELIRYVHLNPVRCGDCTLDELDRYEWSGHRTVINNTSNDLFAAGDILSHFGSIDSVEAYIEFVRSECVDYKIISRVRAANQGEQKFSNSKYWVIGDEKFTQKIIEQDQCRRVQIARYVRENVSLDVMLEKVKNCVQFDMQNIVFHGRLNEISTARQVFATIGRYHFDFSCVSLARYLKISASAVSRMIARSIRITELDFLTKMICATC